MTSAMRKVCLALALAAALPACSAISGRETAGQYVDDSTITTEVKAKLAQDDGLKAYQINVETMQGVVQLSGFVDNSKMKYRAEEVASNVKGVKSVHDNIIVRPSSNG